MNRKGFTLIELMIVVAIIGILAAIAIPNFLAMQLRAKRAELPSNLDGIRTAEKAYQAEWDAFTSAIATPPNVPGRQQTEFANGGIAEFQMLGWTADGKVRGSYSVQAATSGGPGGALWQDAFTATAQSDVDGDNALAGYTATNAAKPSMFTANNIY